MAKLQVAARVLHKQRKQQGKVVEVTSTVIHNNERRAEWVRVKLDNGEVVRAHESVLRLVS